MRSAIKLLSVLAVVLIAVTTKTEAVAFKMKNDSSSTFRARAFDRGEWRSWVTFNPGGWDDFAPGVKRREHNIEIDIWNGQEWVPIYRDHHGSKLWTRVVQVIEGPDGLYFAWWDEPGGGCRDAPPHPIQGGKTCLRPSGGWMWNEMFKYARKVAGAYVIGQ